MRLKELDTKRLNNELDELKKMEENRRTYVTPQSESLVADELELLAASAFSEGDLGQLGTGGGMADPSSGL